MTIYPINFAPEVCSIAQRYTKAGEPFSFTIDTLDNDEDAQSITVSGNPSWMSISAVDSSSSQLTGTPLQVTLAPQRILL